MEIASQSPAQGGTATFFPQRTSEHWVQSSDGSVGGYIDRIKRTQEGIVIQDYKTGAITEENESAIRESYAIQMKLYAGLYHARYGQWPAALELVPQRGGPSRVPFTHEECVALLEEARSLLRETNAAIENGNLEILASPAAVTCRFCCFRPSCYAYRAARDVAIHADDWPNDIWGILLNLETSGDGRRSLAIAVERAGLNIVTVSRLTPGPERHPALGSVSIGDRISCFNLRQTASPANYVESANTVIYKD